MDTVLTNSGNSKPSQSRKLLLNRTNEWTYQEVKMCIIKSY